MKKKWLYLLLAACLMLTACGKKDETTAPENALDSSWEEIIERGTLIVCQTAEEPSLQDFSRELTEQISQRLGITAEVIQCSQKQAKEQIKKTAADLAFGKADKALGCSETILNIDGEEYALLYRKDDKEFASLLASVLQTMANEDLLVQMSMKHFDQDYSVIPSQVDTGLPTEEEAEEYDKRLKEMR